MMKQLFAITTRPFLQNLNLHPQALVLLFLSYYFLLYFRYIFINYFRLSTPQWKEKILIASMILKSIDILNWMKLYRSFFWSLNSCFRSSTCSSISCTFWIRNKFFFSNAAKISQSCWGWVKYISDGESSLDWSSHREILTMWQNKKSWATFVMIQYRRFRRTSTLWASQKHFLTRWIHVLFNLHYVPENDN